MFLQHQVVITQFRFCETLQPPAIKIMRQRIQAACGDIISSQLMGGALGTVPSWQVAQLAAHMGAPGISSRGPSAGSVAWNSSVDSRRAGASFVAGATFGSLTGTPDGLSTGLHAVELQPKNWKNRAILFQFISKSSSSLSIIHQTCRNIKFIRILFGKNGFLHHFFNFTALKSER